MPCPQVGVYKVPIYQEEIMKQKYTFSNEKNKVGLGQYAPWLTMLFNVVWCNQKQIRFDEIKVTFIQVHEITKRDSTVNSSTRRKIQNK